LARFFIFLPKNLQKFMDKTIYTDGQGITVTNTEFYAGSSLYSIEGIINARMLLVKAALTPIFLLLISGIAVMITGFLHLYSDALLNNFYFAGILITANRLAIMAGFVFLLYGIILSITTRDRYAVHLVTVEGEKDPVISTRKDYVYQIVLALQKALNYQHTHAT
jgi:hypothetical protein